ncbi:MAG: PKD domain-containing protein [Planctomycetes bacterium]|nr:PKD domain-containing protein [Planctomycetota bacterium]
MPSRNRTRGWTILASLAALCLIVASCSGGSDGGSSGGGGSSNPPTPVLPVVDFSASQTSVMVNTAITFTDLSTNTPTAWEWDFDGNSTLDSTTQNPTHTYTVGGTYSVRLTVANAAGNATLLKTAYITVTAPVSGTADLDSDSDRSGTVDASDDANENVWNTQYGAVFHYNIDDDNNNNNEDFNETTKTGNDIIDLARVFVRQFPSPPVNGSATITVNATAQGRIRVHRLNGASWTSVYSTGASFTLPLASISAGDIELGIEGTGRLSSSWDGHVTLTLEIRDAGNVLHSSDAIRLRQAPPLFATNLWPVIQLHIINVGSGTYGNLNLRNSLTTICNNAGFTFTQIPGGTYNNDRWLQDSSEPAVTQVPSSSGPRRIIDLVYQCYRLRECDQWCVDALFNPDWELQRRFGTVNSSLNYGGNIEVIPPHTGRAWGRVYIGGGNGFRVGTTQSATEYMDTTNRQYFDANYIQGTHVEVTSEWLAVGHVDEFTMFLPAPNTTRGYACLIASPDLGASVLTGLGSGGAGLTVFAGRTVASDYWQTTVGAITGNAALMTLQGQTQARIDQARTQIKTASGLTDNDFIELPVMFENAGSNFLAAYNPGVVNCIVMPSANGTTYIAMPDPEGPDSGGVDVWQQSILNQINNPASPQVPLYNGANPMSLTFVDVFYSYHALLGECHCGTNTRRIPPADDWWDK